MKRAGPVSTALAAAIILTACTGDPTPLATSVGDGSPPTEVVAPLPSFQVGQVNSVGGYDDESVNALSYEGVQAAIAQIGIGGNYLEAQQPSDYARNIQQFLDEDVDLIISFGPGLALATASAARAYPDRKFAIVDYTFPDCEEGMLEGRDCGSATELLNVRGLTFQIEQAAFLAGYLAAGITKTGKVGTYGSVNARAVTVIMNGFEQGVSYYNNAHGTTIEVKGGISQASGGLFTGNNDSTDDGRAYALALILDGVDIIMPVAGATGQGSAAVCKETRQCLVIGVETDWYASAPEYREIVLTSVRKRIDVAVYDTIQDAIEGKFTGGTVVYTIMDGAVDLAPFHDLDESVPDSLKSEIESLRELLSEGALTVNDNPGGGQ